MLFKTKNNPLHPSSRALPLPYVLARVTRGALVAHRHSFAPPRLAPSVPRNLCALSVVSLWNDLSDIVFHAEVLRGFMSRENDFLLA